MSSNRSQHLEDKAHRAPVLSEVLSCPVCLSIFNNPVTLHCQHNFCKSCLDQSWDQAGTQECPVCWRRSCLEPCPNFTLQNIVESYLKEQEPATVSKGMCILHRESLKLFCLDDHEALCVVCQTSRSHLNHRIWPVEELALDYREQLKKVLIPMEKKMSTFIYFKEECVKSCGYIKTQTQQTETEIKQEFQKLHKFLQDEEAARIAALREEEEQKSEIMKDNIENITREILSLSDTMKSIKLEIGVEDLSFLANIKDTVKRTQCQMQDPEGVSGALIDVAKHLGSLKYRVWEKMLGIVQYTPVTLDPNTVHPHLSLSKDLTSVTCSQKQEFPENPERFKNCVSVLGSEGFTSGRHCWEVEVGDKQHWDLGVAKESIKRKKGCCLTPDQGFWVISMCKGNLYQVEKSSRIDLKLKRKPQKIRIQLECEKGKCKISFFDARDMASIYTFKFKCTEKIFPYFSPCLNDDDDNNPCPLKICPSNINVKVE